MDSCSLLKVFLPTSSAVKKLKQFLYESTRPEDDEAFEEKDRVLYEYFEFADDPIKVRAFKGGLLIDYEATPFEDYQEFASALHKWGATALQLYFTDDEEYRGFHNWTGRYWEEVYVVDDDGNRFTDLSINVDSLTAEDTFTALFPSSIR